MEADDISYKIIRRIQELEKNSPTLTKINSNFYLRLSDYLKNLDKILEKEENPQKSKLLHDEIENTRKIATNVYEPREKKIVQAALSKSRGGKPDLQNMLNIEKKLYESIVDIIAQTRENILKKKTSESNKKSEKPVKSENSKKKGNENPIVRITSDIPEFVGTDMKKYNLRKEDVLSLPKEMADPLLKRGVIKQIK